MKLSVIIVSYNVRHYLSQCLLSVQRAMDGIEGEVIVFDNHSKDGSVEWLAPRFPDVTFISSTNNLGFAKANNKAIQSYNDLAGKKVATQAGSTGPAILAQFAPKAVVQEF